MVWNGKVSGATGVGDLGDESGASSLPTGPEFTAPPPDGISWSAVISRPPKRGLHPTTERERLPTTPFQQLR